MDGVDISILPGANDHRRAAGVYGWIQDVAVCDEGICRKTCLLSKTSKGRKISPFEVQKQERILIS